MYAILRHGKLNRNNKAAAERHNHRLDVGHANIDTELSKFNKYTNDGFVSALNAKLPEKRRKDAVEAVELVLSASPEFFDAINTDRAKLADDLTLKKWANASHNFLKSEFGSNLIDVVLHMDESSPHIHAIVIPLTKDGRLNANGPGGIMSKLEMRARQTRYAEAMAQFGLCRGQSSTETKRAHVSLKDSLKLARRASKVVPPPVKNGLLDTGYVDRLYRYALEVREVANSLLLEKSVTRFSSKKSERHERFAASSPRSGQ